MRRMSHEQDTQGAWAFDAFGRNQDSWERALPLLRFLFRRYFRVRCSGMEHIPAEGRAVLVANHAGVLPYDALMLMTAFSEELMPPRVLRPLIEDLFYHAPFLGPLLYRLGCVRACQENGHALLEEDKPVLVFPEGYQGLGKPFAQRYRLRRFGRGGFIKLALRTRAPIVPVAVVGAEEIHPILGKLSLFSKAFRVPYFPITPTFPALGPLGLLPLPSPWMIRFGEPIVLPHEPEQADDPLLVNRLVEEIRAHVQRMVTALVAERGGWLL